jgi:hypothetical protein
MWPDAGYEEDTCGLPSGHDGWRRLGGHAGQEAFEIQFRTAHATCQRTPSAVLRGSAGRAHPPDARSSSEPDAAQSRLGEARQRRCVDRCFTARVDDAPRALESRLKAAAAEPRAQRAFRLYGAGLKAASACAVGLQLVIVQPTVCAPVALFSRYPDLKPSEPAPVE